MIPKKPTFAVAGTVLARLAQYLVLAAALIAALGPVAWAVLSSFKTSQQILTDVFSFPIPPSIDGYRDAIQQVDLLRFIGNSFLYALAAGVLCPLVALMVAYPCARLRFPFRKAISIAISGGLAVPIVCLITPEFFIMLRTGLLDTKVGMIIFYTAIFMPLAFVILRANLLSIPKEVEEAAALDGASYYRTLFHIVAPMVIPGILTVGISSSFSCGTTSSGI